MLGSCLAPKRKEMSSLGDVIPGTCNPWEVPSSGDVTARPTARLSGPGAVPAHPGDTSKVQVCPGAVVTSWVSTTLPAPWIFGEAGEYVQDLGSSSGAALGLKAGISSMPPGEWLWSPRHTHFVSPRQRWGVPKGFPNCCLNQSWAVGTVQEGVQAHGDGGCKNSPLWGKRKQGCPLVSPVSPGPPRRGGQQEGTRTRHSLVSPRGRPGRGVARAGVYRR